MERSHHGATWNQACHREVSLGPCCFYFSITTCQTKSNAISSCLQLDDAKIFKTVKNEEDHQDLVEDLDNLENWGRLWQMRFNVGKCKMLHLGKRNPRHEYNMGDLTW